MEVGWAGTERVGMVCGLVAYQRFWWPEWSLVEHGASDGVVGWNMVTRRGGAIGGRLGEH